MNLMLRLYLPSRALETYKMIHRRFPENIECLKFLVKLTSDMGLKEASEYASELKKAEKAKDLRDQRATSSRPGSTRRSSSRTSLDSRRTGSAVSNELQVRKMKRSKKGQKSQLF